MENEIVSLEEGISRSVPLDRGWWKYEDERPGYYAFQKQKRLRPGEFRARLNERSYDRFIRVPMENYFRLYGGILEKPSLIEDFTKLLRSDVYIDLINELKANRGNQHNYRVEGWSKKSWEELDPDHINRALLSRIFGLNDKVLATIFVDPTKNREFDYYIDQNIMPFFQEDYFEGKPTGQYYMGGYQMEPAVGFTKQLLMEKDESPRRTIPFIDRIWLPSGNREADLRCFDSLCTLFEKLTSCQYVDEVTLITGWRGCLAPTWRRKEILKNER